MRIHFFLLLILIFSGCSPIPSVERVKRGEGFDEIYDLGIQEIRKICERSAMDIGLKIRSVREKKDRIIIFAYEQATETEYGSTYAIFLSSRNPHTTELKLVRRMRYPTRAFVRDATEELFAKIDEYVLEAKGI